MRVYVLACGLALGAAVALSACGSSPSGSDSQSTYGPSLSAAAEAARPSATAPAGIEQATEKLFAGKKPLMVRDSPIPGLKEVIVAGGVFYASPDGKYFMQGDMIEVATMKSKTEEARALPRAEAIRNVDVKDSITFKAKGKERYEVYVFTDTDCGYCRKLHSQVAEYNAEGITVHYFPWPRSGAQGPTYDTMVSVWCAKDKQAALTDAKNGRPVPAATCDNPVAKYVDIGHQLMINGTPAIFTKSAQQMGGYVPPAELRKALEAVSKDR